MLVLDTDVVSLIRFGRGPDADRLRGRIHESGEPDAITIVTLEELFRGRLAQCAKATTPDRYLVAARLLRETFEDCREREILDFDDRAAAEFRRLKAAKVRVGTMDLRIAALAHAATLITRNLSDFRKVPGLRAEDWAA